MIVFVLRLSIYVIKQIKKVPNKLFQTNNAYIVCFGKIQIEKKNQHLRHIRVDVEKLFANFAYKTLDFFDFKLRHTTTYVSLRKLKIVF